MKSIRRVLVAQPYGLGDALFLTPVVRALRTLPTVERVDLLLGSRTESVFRNNPHVDRIFSIDKDHWRRSGTGAVLKDLRGLRAELKDCDTLLDFSLQREYSFYGQFLFGIGRRLGFNYSNRGTFLTDSLPLPQGFEKRHAVDFYADLGRFLSLEIEDRFLEFYISDNDREEAGEFLRQKSISPTSRFIVVAPGGGESWGKDAVFKRWPVTFFLNSLPLLKKRLDFEGVLVLGSQEERNLGEEMVRESGLSVINLAGEPTLGQAAAILEKAALFFANDGGLVHLAHSLQTPLVALYGPVDPVVYGPYPASPRALAVVKKNLPCRPCYHRFRYNSNCIDRECLTALLPEEVFEFLDRKNFWNQISSLRGSNFASS